MRRKLRRVVHSTRLGRRLAKVRADRIRRARLSSDVARVLAAGVLDRAWYEAQRGTVFADDRAAVLDYLRHGRFDGYSINPFLEPATLAPRGQYKTAVVDPVVAYLDTEPGRSRTEPVFDDSTWLTLHPEARQHPGRAVGHFMATAQADTPLPVRPPFPGAAPLWGDWHRRAIEAAATWPAKVAITMPRVSTTWDREREQQFVRTWTGRAPQPEGDAPLVSIVMPVRNRPVLITTAIASVQAQTLGSWELVVVDDGSTDHTPDVVAGMAATDPRIRLVRKEHGGVSAARNAGLQSSRGRYVAFLDSDNVWRPQFLELATAALDGTGHAVGYAGLAVHQDGRTTYLAFEGGYEHLLVVNHIDQNVLVAERTALEEAGGFDQRLRRWVDHDLVLRLARTHDLMLLPFLGADITVDPDRDDRITTREGDGWAQVVLDKQLIDWDGLRESLPERVPGRVSVVIPTFNDYLMTLPAVEAVLRATPDLDVEVVVVDNGCGRRVMTILASVLGALPGVQVVRNSRNLHFALGSNTGLAVTTGEFVVFLNNDTVVQDGWLHPLLEELRDPGVVAAQPLLVYDDDTIQCAGVVFPGGGKLPSHFLPRFPTEDVLHLGRFPVRAITGAALAMRATDAIELHGFDPLYVNGWEDIDLCFRLADLHPGSRFVVATDSRVRHLESKTPGRGAKILANRELFLSRWRDRLDVDDHDLYPQAGFELLGFEPPVDDPDPTAVPRPQLAWIRRTNDDGTPQLRWAVKIAAHAGPRGDHWGDVYFAADLARALRELGQYVVVDRRDAYDRPSNVLDDVTVVIRGLDEVPLVEGQTSLLWVISHPDLVTADEIRSYTAAFAASGPWAERMTAEAGVPVRPLLQATDPSRFHPHPDHEGTTPYDDQVLFVGSYRADRPVVETARAAGVPLRLYGTRWREHGYDDVLAGDGVPNAILGLAYARAGVVLCDHWADMAREGFAANRLFDAVASGTRVVSDEVAGLEEVFGPLVRTWRDADDLVRLTGPERDTAFLPDEERLAAAREFAERHSFLARARELLAVALELTPVAAPVDTP